MYVYVYIAISYVRTPTYIRTYPALRTHFIGAATHLVWEIVRTVTAPPWIVVKCVGCLCVWPVSLFTVLRTLARTTRLLRRVASSTSIYTYIHIHIHIYICMYSICVHLHIYIYIFITISYFHSNRETFCYARRTLPRKKRRLRDVASFTNISLSIYLYLSISLSLYIYTHIYIYTYIHIYTHIYTVISTYI